MPPNSDLAFLRAAARRFAAAGQLHRVKMNLDALYLAGYTVECSIKAVILHATAKHDRAEMLKRISSGKSMHDYGVLLGLLRNLGVPFPLQLTKKLRHPRNHWSTDLRYESARQDHGETRHFLDMA